MNQFPNTPGPGPGGYHGHGHGSPPGQGKAIASLVLGIVALLGSWFYVGVILAIVGIVLALSARRDGAEGGLATAGLVISIIALALSGLWTICTILVCTAGFALF